MKLAKYQGILCFMVGCDKSQVADDPYKTRSSGMAIPTEHMTV